MSITDFTLDQSYPVVLLPVRVETRFDLRTAGSERFLVRIYPDEIFADAHEQKLTAGELADGQQYWTDIWGKGTDTAGEQAKRDAWRALLKPYKPQRAAWIVIAAQPTNMANILTDAQPTFATPAAGDLRSSSWTQAVVAPFLPDRWVVYASRGSRTNKDGSIGPLKAQTKDIDKVNALQLTTSPNPAATTSVAYNLTIDSGALWTLDFTEAVNKGMAIEVTTADLTADDIAQGFDEVTVFGVRTGATAEKQLAALLDAHHYSGGLAIVPQGTPTNNTHLGRSGYPPDDPNGEVSYAVERGGSLLAKSPTSDGNRLALALGLPALAGGAQVFDHVESADNDDVARAKAMARALWPSTLGYFMEQLAAPLFTDADYQAMKAYFVDQLQARGQLPVFRVGRVPYGVVPIIDFTQYNYVPTGTGALAQDMSKYLQMFWGAAKADDIPRITPGSVNPEADLAKVLSREASSTGFEVNTGIIGPSTIRNFAHLLSDSWRIDSTQTGPTTATPNKQVKLWFDNWVTKVDTDYQAQHHWPAGWEQARIVWMQQMGQIAATFNGTMVADISSETVTLSGIDLASGSTAATRPDVYRSFGFNYINWLCTASPRDIRERTYPKREDDPTQAATEPTSLLFEMLRRATLQTYLRMAYDFTKDTTPRAESELLIQETSRLSKLDATGVAGVTGGRTLGDYLHASDYVDPAGLSLKNDRDQFFAALQLLAQQPTLQLEWLLGETLDLLSHRLDAWITSLAQLRLNELRAAKPAGCWVGGYAYVENVRPIKRVPGDGTEQDKTTGTDVPVKVEVPDATLTGGFIQTPSLNHANTTAVLLSGARAHPTDPASYAVDLRSYKVRQAREVLDSVRAGVPLGAVLGGMVEKWMHGFATNYSGGAGLLVPDLTPSVYAARAAFPLVSSKPVVNPAPGTGDTALPAATSADGLDSRSVVDGLRIYKNQSAWETGPWWWPSGAVKPPPPPGPGYACDIPTALASIYQQLADCVGGLTDTLLSESIYQMTRGNTSAAASSLEGMAQGLRPPDPEFVRTPTQGYQITQRALLVLSDAGSNPVALDSHWPSSSAGGKTPAPTPRAAAEPFLDAWVGSLLGDPSKIECQVNVPDGTAGGKNVYVNLAQLGLCPLDFLALAKSASSGQAEAELDRRVIDAAMAAAGVTSVPGATISYGPSRAGTLSFLEMLELGAQVNAMLAKARAMTPADLAVPANAAAAGTVDEANAAARAKVATDALAAVGLDPALAGVAAGTKTAADLRAALRAAALLGVPSAYPPPAGTLSSDATQELAQLTAMAQAVAKDVDARAADVAAAGADPSGLALAALGRDFLFLPRFTLASGVAADLTGSIADTTLRFGADSKAVTLNRWFTGAAKVRPVLARWARVRLYLRALTKSVTQWEVAQLPFHSGEDWVGGALTATDPASMRGKVSLLLQRAGSVPTATSSWAGLYLDEWTETLPAATRTTGVAFNYDNPGAEAPQTVLIGVPCDTSKAWTLDLVYNIINMALELATIRAVSPADLQFSPNYLPLLYYPVAADYPPMHDTLHAQLTTTVIPD